MSEPSDPIASLWRFDGTVSRKSYALVGFIGFAIKAQHRPLHRSEIIYTRINGLLNYWAPLNKAALLAHLSYREKQFLFTLVLGFLAVYLDRRQSYCSTLARRGTTSVARMSVFHSLM